MPVSFPLTGQEASGPKLIFRCLTLRWWAYSNEATLHGQNLPGSLCRPWPRADLHVSHCNLEIGTPNCPLGDSLFWLKRYFGGSYSGQAEGLLVNSIPQSLQTTYSPWLTPPLALQEIISAWLSHMCWGSENTMRQIFPWSKEMSTELHYSEMMASVRDPGPFTEQTAQGSAFLQKNGIVWQPGTLLKAHDRVFPGASVPRKHFAQKSRTGLDTKLLWVI